MITDWFSLTFFSLCIKNIEINPTPGLEILLKNDAWRNLNKSLLKGISISKKNDTFSVAKKSTNFLILDDTTKDSVFKVLMKLRSVYGDFFPKKSFLDYINYSGNFSLPQTWLKKKTLVILRLVELLRGLNLRARI